MLAILRAVLEDFRRSSEISEMVGIDAVFGVVGFLPIWAPARLVSEHVESENFHSFVYRVQVLLEWSSPQQTFEHKIILDALRVIQ